MQRKFRSFNINFMLFISIPISVIICEIYFHISRTSNEYNLFFTKIYLYKQEK